MSRLHRCAGLILLAGLLNACALIKPQPGQPNQAAWEARQAEYSQIEQWTVDARMATALFGWSGSLQWQQSGQQLRLNVAGPLGIGGFQAQGDLHHVQVLTSDKQRLAGDPEVLYRDVVGWPFPLRNMRYWSRGLPVPDKPLQPEIDAQGRLSRLEQAGWQIRYTEYRQYGAWELPRRMQLDNGELTIRIVIDDWTAVERS